MDIIRKIERFLQVSAIIVLPLVFFPFELDAVTVPKQLFLMVIASFLFFIGSLRSVIERKIRLPYSPITTALLLFTLVHGIGLFGRETNILDAVSQPLGLLTLICLCIVHISLLHTVQNGMQRMMQWAFLIGGTILSLFSIVSLAGISITPTGDILSTALALSIYLLISAAFLWKQRKNISVIQSMGVLIMVIGIGITGYKMNTTARPVVMPYRVGWVIAQHTIEKSPGFGAGISNYENVYSLFRPISINLTPLWQQRFITGPNAYFHYATVLGFAGLISILFIGFLVLQAILIVPTPISWGIGVVLLYSLFFTPSIIFLLFLFVLPALIPIPVRGITISLPSTRAIASLLLVPILAFIGAISLILPLLMANYESTGAVNAVSKGQNQQAFDKIHKAMQFAPSRPEYTITASRISLGMGMTLMNDKGNTDTQKQQGVTLISQAITDAKQATTTAPQNSTTWQNLGEIYLNLIPVFDKADTWAISSYHQAIQLDPANPSLLTYEATILDYQGHTDTAVSTLEQAIKIKSDFLPAQFALANGYTKLKNYQKGVDQYTILLHLLPKNSSEVKEVTTDRDAAQILLEQQQTVPKAPTL